MDVFVEQLIVRQKRGFEKAFRPLVLIFGFAAAALLIFMGLVSGFIGAFFLAAGFGIGYAAIYASALFDIEYEYSVTNGLFDIDRIVARRKRERLASFDCRDISAIGVYEGQGSVPANLTVYDATGGSGQKYYMVVAGSKGSRVILFEPDERTLAAIKRFIPRSVFVQSFGNKV